MNSRNGMAIAMAAAVMGIGTNPFTGAPMAEMDPVRGWSTRTPRRVFLQSPAAAADAVSAAQAKRLRKAEKAARIAQQDAARAELRKQRASA